MEQILTLLKKSDFLEALKGVLVSKHPPSHLPRI